MRGELHWVDSADELRDFVAYVVLYAPDRFPFRDFLTSEEQLDLEKAFQELRRGLSFLKRRVPDGNRFASLSRLLEDSLEAYRKGDAVKGAHLLQAFDNEVHGTYHR